MEERAQDILADLHEREQQEQERERQQLGLDYRPRMQTLALTVILLAAMSMGATIGWSAKPAPAALASPDAREQYYRGVFDVCRTVMNYPADMCLEALQSTVHNQWYESPSPQWHWPLQQQPDGGATDEVRTLRGDA